jgi:hypothetical protein
MGKLTASFPLIAGICILLVLAGVWIDRNVLTRRIQRVEYEVIETPVKIPVKTEAKKGIISPPTPETKKRDSTLATSPCDSVRKWAINRLQPFEQTFMDTIDVKKDSTVSFQARALIEVKVDPWTHVITKTLKFQDAILKATQITIHDTELIASPWWTAVAFVAGFLLALLVG